MRDHSHHSPDDTGFCEHCGQPLPATRLPSYGEKRTNRVGIGITVALHLLLVIVYLFQPKMEKHATPPSKGEIVYIAPLATKPKQKESAKASKPVKVKTAPVQMKRLPNTITLPHEKPVEVVKEPSKEAPKETPKPPAPEVDMMAAIEAKRAARGATQSTQPAEETASERGNRLAKANIAAANGKSRGNDDSESGGMFELTNRTYHSADVKFRTFNPNFKRRWLKTVTVEQGSEVDLETAIVKKMIAMIREERTGDIDWDSHRQQRIVKLSARIEDTAELTAFLMSEMFPEHRVVRR